MANESVFAATAVEDAWLVPDVRLVFVDAVVALCTSVADCVDAIVALFVSVVDFVDDAIVFSVVGVVLPVADLAVLAMTGVLAELTRLDDFALLVEEVVDMADKEFVLTDEELVLTDEELVLTDETAPLAADLDDVFTLQADLGFLDVLDEVCIFALVVAFAAADVFVVPIDMVTALTVLIVFALATEVEWVEDEAVTERTSRLSKPATMGRNMRRMFLIKFQKGDCFNVRVCKCFR